MAFVMMESLKLALIKETRKKFHKAGWDVSESIRKEIDYIIFRGGEFRFFVQCIDGAMMRSISVTGLIDELEQQAHFIRTQRGHDAVFIFNFQLQNVTLPELAKRKIVAVHTDELDIVTTLPDRVDALTMDGEVRQHLLCANRPRIAISIARAFKAKGDEGKAVSWLETALLADPDFPPAAMDLGDVYFGRKDYAQAETVLRTGLKANATNLFLLRRLERVLKLRQDTAGTQEIAARISAAEAARPKVATADPFAKHASLSPAQAPEAVVPNDGTVRKLLSVFSRGQGKQ